MLRTLPVPSRITLASALLLTACVTSQSPRGHENDSLLAEFLRAASIKAGADRTGDLPRRTVFLNIDAWNAAAAAADLPRVTADQVGGARTDVEALRPRCWQEGRRGMCMIDPDPFLLYVTSISIVGDSARVRAGVSFNVTNGAAWDMGSMVAAYVFARGRGGRWEFIRAETLDTHR